MGDAAMVSLRMPSSTRDGLDAAAAVQGETRTALIQRYIDEGLRMDRHPGVLFRPGPAGRRPSLVAGPDIWEVIQAVLNVEARGQAVIAVVAEDMALTTAQVSSAVAYYADYQAEIDEWIARNAALAERAEQAWLREQAILR